ncbi:TPA: hypothetical protein MJA80_20085 [Klebsiella pneumoniae]|nr:Uncharacterised protein [Klebsiella pneumoniae]HBZ0069123.1 hypothetical protein [Klebsiella pneumoniae subsp. ozaenae]STR82230.1 Uncharacterised protein [Klebsiella pneumoniae]STR91537.1 Uncharacterised protein [Klebsiella pneumoniae]STS03232.1 Uncharacterised protein [Klebsiella pneumoniae]
MHTPVRPAWGGMNIPHQDLESITLDAENLYNLLDLMLLSSEKLRGEQLERLLGLALNLSDDLQQWFRQEYERRENKSD